jgi:hypothetical protein
MKIFYLNFTFKRDLLYFINKQTKGNPNTASNSNKKNKKKKPKSIYEKEIAFLTASRHMNSAYYQVIINKNYKKIFQNKIF